MATVVGVTAERADAIEDQLIVGAQKSGSSLVFTKSNGETFQIENIFPKIVDSYPVGSIYMTENSANPSTYMGGGTWVRYGKGRVPVSLDEAQTEFDAVGEEGGAKTHTLTTPEMPNHGHSGTTGTESAYHTHSGTTSADGTHTHGYEKAAGNQDVDASEGAGTAMDNNYNSTQTNANGSHQHTMTTGNQSAGHTHDVTVGAVGGGGPHNNLQPYIVCYMWKRTA